ncbi:MAG: hypothetical protein JRM85_05555 [Nitrososphaerota archaeon]|nr:hypothetical protein [Nitrososphaerota archaeon]MDG6918114.1 hypothetical protein [Nitrososphaerota archaeon]
MRGSFLGLAIFGIVLLLLGTIFALQGDGMIGGSSMTGVPFWIYAGSVIAVVGVLMAALGFVLASRGKAGGATTPVQTK